MALKCLPRASLPAWPMDWWGRGQAKDSAGTNRDSGKAQGTVFSGVPRRYLQVGVSILGGLQVGLCQDLANPEWAV